MAHPLVVNCKQDEFDVYIGRPSKWGNPFRVLHESQRMSSIAQFEKMVRQNPKAMKMIKEELKGKVLGCWCAPKACHGDVLAKIANEED